MEALRIETTVTQNGVLTLAGLPVRAGDEVEVIVLIRGTANENSTKVSLHGLPIRYDDPTGPVAAEDWQAGR